jgi:transposase
MKLTDEQLHRAARAADDLAKSLGFPEMAPHISDDERNNVLFMSLRAAAPYLQLPWDEPTEKEAYACQDAPNVQDNEPQQVIAEFVRRRNAALIPKPENPIVKDALANLRGVTLTHDEAQKITAAVWGCTDLAGEYRHSVFDPPTQKPETFGFGFTGFKDLPERQTGQYLDSMLSDSSKIAQPRPPIQRNPADMPQPVDPRVELAARAIFRNRFVDDSMTWEMYEKFPGSLDSYWRAAKAVVAALDGAK